MKYSVVMSLLLLTGCVAQPTVKSWLDPVSYATITAQNEPLVMSRVAVLPKLSDRDFAKLVAVEVNRMGTRNLLLAAILRTTAAIPQQRQEHLEEAFAKISIRADDRSVALTRYEGDVAALGMAELPLDISGAQPIYFMVNRDDLSAIASSSTLELVALGQPSAEERYYVWKDGRQSLSAFLSQLPSTSASL